MRVLFIADQHADAHRTDDEHHPGGAELTDAAALAACPWPTTVLRWADLNLVELDHHDVIVLGNSQRATDHQLMRVAETKRHVLFEHDLRVCRWNGNFAASLEPLHSLDQRCWCPHAQLWELYDRALGTIYLTERQRRVYLQNPSYREGPHAVLGSSLFADSFFVTIERARATRETTARHGARILYSPNAIKGTREARAWCVDRGIPVTEIRDLSPEEVLESLATAEAFVYLPRGLEPAGRMPVEARLLGCDVFVNDHVGVAGEAWWRGTREAAVATLREQPARFWRLVVEFMQLPPRPATAPRVATRRHDAARAAHWLLRSAGATPRAIVERQLTTDAVRHRTENVQRFAPW